MTTLQDTVRRVLTGHSTTAALRLARDPDRLVDAAVAIGAAEQKESFTPRSSGFTRADLDEAAKRLRLAARYLSEESRVGG